MAIRNVDDLFNELSSNESFSGLFASSEDLASALDVMSPDRRDALFDKIGAAEQVSKVDFDKIIKKKDDSISNLRLVGDDKGKKAAAPQSQPAVSSPLQPTGSTQNPNFPEEKPLTLIPNDPPLGSPLKRRTLQEVFPQTNKEKERKTQSQAIETSMAKQKANRNVYAPPPKRQITPEQVKQSQELEKQLKQQSDIPVIEKINWEAISEGKEFKRQGDAVARAKKEQELTLAKQSGNSLFKGIEKGIYQYALPDGRQFKLDEYAIGRSLFENEPIEIFSSTGSKIDILDPNKNFFSGDGNFNVVDDRSIRDHLSRLGLSEEQADEEVLRLKQVYLKEGAKATTRGLYDQLITKYNGNETLANQNFRNYWNNRGLDLLEGSEKEAYHIVKQMEALRSKLITEEKKGGLSSFVNTNAVEYRKRLNDFQDQLSELRDNPNNLYDWRTGQFIDTRIKKDSARVAEIQQENKEFQSKYGDKPKDALIERRDALLAQRAFVMGKMNQFDLDIPEEGTWGAAVRALQISAARSAGTGTIVLPDGRTVSASSYKRKMDDYNSQLYSIMSELYGVNRAVMLNENVALRKESETLLGSISKNIGSALESVAREFTPGAISEDANSEFNIRNGLLNSLEESGYVVDKSLRSAASVSVAETISGSAGMLVSSMVQIALGNVAVPEIMALRWANQFKTILTNKYGKIGGAVFEQTANAVRSGAIFQAAGQGFMTGVGESGAQVAFDALNLDNILGTKGRVANFLYRSLIGGAGETFEELAGQYVQSLTDAGFDANKAFSDAFGAVPESRLDQVLVIGITSLGFSGASNLKLLTATRSKLNEILDDPKLAAAFGEVLTPEKKQQVEDVLKAVDDKLADKQSRQTNAEATGAESSEYTPRVNSEEAQKEIAKLNEERQTALNDVQVVGGAQNEEQKADIEQQTADINAYYDEQVRLATPPQTTFDSVTGTNQSAVLGNADLNSEQTQNFLASLPNARARRNAATLIAVANNANTTLESVLPNAKIVLHSRDSFRDKMSQIGEQANRKGNFTIITNPDGTTEIEIQINVEDGAEIDIAHEVTHGVLFGKFYGDDKRLAEIAEVRANTQLAPEQVDAQIQEINQKYETQFSETLGKFKDQLKDLVSEKANTYLEKFVASYDENAKAEEYLTELTSLLNKHGEQIRQEDPSFFERLLALINKLVGAIGKEAGIKLQKFEDTQEVVDFFNTVASSIKKGEALTETKTPKTDAVQEQTTGQVPVQSETTVGQEVVQGEPQAESQVATQEGEGQKIIESVPEKNRLYHVTLTEKPLEDGVLKLPSESNAGRVIEDTDAVFFSRLPDWSGRGVSHSRLLFDDRKLQEKLDKSRETNQEKELLSGKNVEISKENGLSAIELFVAPAPFDVKMGGFLQDDPRWEPETENALVDEFVRQQYDANIETMTKEAQVYADKYQVPVILKVEDSNIPQTVVVPKSSFEGQEVKSKARKEVADLRSQEQTELLAAIPNLETFRVNGKIDTAAMSPEQRAEYDEIYNKYDKLITPLLAKKPAQQARSKSQVVFHAGTLQGEGNVYVTPDRQQADAYGRESGDKVIELNVDPSQLASEDYVKSKIEELGYESPGGTIDELMIPMLMDERFDDTALNPEEIETVKNILKEEGYTGISFMDEDILQRKKEGVENYLIFDTKDLQRTNQEEDLEIEEIDTEQATNLAGEKILEDTDGSLYEQKNLNVSGIGGELSPTDRVVNKARFDVGENGNFDVDGIALVPPVYISASSTRNKKYNATMSDHTKVGSYVNAKSGVTVKDLFGGLLFSWIAENFNAEVVWASTGIKQARELIENSKGQDMTLIYRMNRASGSNGNINFATAAWNELTAPIKKGRITESQMLSLLNQRFTSITIGKTILSSKDITKFESLQQIEDTIMDLAFAVRGPLWSQLLNVSYDVQPTGEYGKKLDQLGVARVVDIVDNSAEGISDDAADSDIVGALSIAEPEYVEIVEKGKTKLVPKIYTTFPELVNEEQGVFLTAGVQHKSYPYVVKGKPLGIFEEFHSVTDFFPIIKEWMSKTTKAEGYLSKEQFLEKNKAKIQEAEALFEEAETRFKIVKGSITKEDRKKLLDELKELEKAVKQAKRFTPRLSSPYKAIETMHKELMANFDSTQILSVTERAPVKLDITNKGRVEPWSTPQQEISSAGTSINKAKLPSVYSDKKFFELLKGVSGKSIVIADIGSGKYANVNIKPLLEKGEIAEFITESSKKMLGEKALPALEEILGGKDITYHPYDPFNQPALVNEETINVVRDGGADIAVSPNVLNVIAEAGAREGVIANLANAVGVTGSAVIQIYEGEPKDRGLGKETKTGGETSWQNNQKTDWYMPEVQAYFANVKRSGNIIIADNKGQTSLLGEAVKISGAQKVQVRNKARIEERIKDSKKYGVPQRYRSDVGKMIGGELYVHYSANNVLPQKALVEAESKLPEGFDYEVIKYNAKDGSFSFIASPDWNTSNEPIVGDAYKVKASGEVSVTKQKADPQIYHHKWNFVRDDYSGFNVEQSVQRSIDWYRDAKAEVNIFKTGTQSYWNEIVTPLIKDTTKIINKGRLDRVDFAIVKDFEDFRNQGFSTEAAYLELEKMNYSPGDIKRYIPEVSELWKKRSVTKLFATIRKHKGKITKRQAKIREELQNNPGQNFDTLYDSLKDKYEDFELYKAFYEEGADPALLDEIFGTEYRQTIQKALEETKDGKTVFNQDFLRTLRADARSRKMVDAANQMNNLFGFFNGVLDNEQIIEMLADGLEESGLEFSLEEQAQKIRQAKAEFNDDLNILKKIGREEIKPETIINVSRLLSLAGRMLRMGRGLFKNQESFEKAIFDYLENVQYKTQAGGVVRKVKAFSLTTNQKKKISEAIKEFRQAKQEYDLEIKLLEDSDSAYTDDQFESFDKSKAKFEMAARKLKVTVDAFKQKSTGNWFSSMIAQGLLSFRTVVIGIVGNVEMLLASTPKRGRLLILGWSRSLSNKLVSGFTRKSATEINAMIKRGAYGNIDPTLYRKMAWDQGVQQIRNIFENTIASVSTNEDSFFETQATIDSTRELPTGLKMAGILLKNIFKKDFDKMSDQEWAETFDQLLVLMNEKDAQGNNKLELASPKGYQAATTLLRGVFGYIPTITGKAIAASGDRVFYQYGYYEALASYAYSQGITDPAEVKKFIRLNSVPNAIAGGVAQREGERRIFANDNAITDWFASVRGNIAKTEKNISAKNAILRKEGKTLSRIAQIFPRKIGLIAKKIALTVLSPFTRIPSNFVGTAIEKTVFPYTYIMYGFQQFKLNRMIKEYDALFNLDENATLSASKQKEQERMRAGIFEQQRKTSRYLASAFQATQVAILAFALVQSGAVGAPYGDDEEEKKAARAAGLAGQPPGKINVTAFIEYLTNGLDSKGRTYKEGDFTFGYTNLGIVGFGLTWLSTLRGSLMAQQFEDRTTMGVGENGYGDVTANMILESIGNGITSLSFIQNISALAAATKTGSEGLENFGINLVKTALTVPTMAYGMFGAVEKAEGISPDSMRNYFPDLEADDSIGGKFKIKLWTSMTGKSPISLFGLKNSKGEFLSPFASPYYQPQLGPHGEELYKKNTFWDVRSGSLLDRVGAYLQASIDPFSMSTYEGFVSTVKKYNSKEAYKAGDIVDDGNFVYAIKKNIAPGVKFRELNLDEQDMDFETITSTTDFFDREKYVRNKLGTESTTQLYDLMALYQKSTGSRKEFALLTKFYDPFVSAKDAEGEFSVYIPLKYQRELAKLRGEVVRKSYDANSIKEEIEIIQRSANEMEDKEFNQFVEEKVEDLLLGPINPVSLTRSGGIKTQINEGLAALEDQEQYRTIKRKAIKEGLEGGIFTKAQYDRMVNTSELGSIIMDVPESKLKFRK